MSNVETNNDLERKEEILAMSRSEKKDEGDEHSSLKGTEFGGIIGFYVVGVILVVLSLIMHQLSAAWALIAVYGAFNAGYEFKKYRFTKKVYHIVGFAACIAATLFSIFAFVDFALEWHNIHEFTKAIRWW